MQQPDDIELIRMILHGRTQSFALLVERYQNFVFSLTLRYVTERELAEELAQDIFVKAYRNLADFNGSCKFSTWLYTIVNTTCLSHLRKRKDKTVFMEHDQILQISQHVHSQYETEVMLISKAKKEVLAKAINCLSTDEAQIITLFYQMEQSVDEIGKILGISSGNVKVKLFRSRQKLREILETRFMNDLQ